MPKSAVLTSADGTSTAETMRVSVIVPVMDETASLEETVRIVLADNAKSVSEILLVVCRFTTAESMAVCHSLCDRRPGLCRIVEQRLPYLGGAIRDAFDAATGTHVLLMASDLETEPATAKDLIARASEGWDVVTATRWHGQRDWRGYDPLKFVLNWVFQHVVGALYRTRLTDLTFGYRIFRTSLVQQIRWEELRHPFLLETIIKPLRLGARVTEVPTSWRARPEGISHNTFWRNFAYFRIAFRARLMSRAGLLKQSSKRAA